MKVALYSPYLDTFGGGEKYILTIAEILSKTAKVDVLLGTHLHNLDTVKFRNKIGSLHKIDLTNVNFTKAPIGEGSSSVKRIFFLKSYGILFYLTDGSLFFSTAKKSFIHFQVPLILKDTLSNRLKLKSFKKAIYNSEFTKVGIERNLKIKGEVIFPPVNVKLFKLKRKKKQILSVGRFYGFLKDKKHAVLIEAFRKLITDNKLGDWSLHLVGAASESDQDYLKELKNIGQKLPIFFYPNLPYEELVLLYEESAIYWHAAGFGESDPSKMEHFGITTVEAMAAGCVPIVINKGGQLEIVEDQVSGFFWQDIEEMIKKTLLVIENTDTMKKVGNNAVKRSKLFSKEIFEQKILQLINE